MRPLTLDLTACSHFQSCRNKVLLFGHKMALKSENEQRCIYRCYYDVITFFSYDLRIIVHVQISECNQ